MSNPDCAVGWSDSCREATVRRWSSLQCRAQSMANPDGRKSTIVAGRPPTTVPGATTVSGGTTAPGSTLQQGLPSRRQLTPEPCPHAIAMDTDPITQRSPTIAPSMICLGEPISSAEPRRVRSPEQTCCNPPSSLAPWRSAQ